MAGLSDSFLQELKMRSDIEDIVSSYVTLKKRGNTFVGLCPFHNEKTPSFTVYPDTQSFYCFGCGAGGDSLSFIKKIENLDYIDAVKLLAQRVGLQMPDEGYDDSLSKKRRKIFEINRATALFYHKYLMSEQGRVGFDYFHNKRALSVKTIQHFGLGYAPNQWDALLKHLKELGYSVSDMLAAGVIRKGEKGYYDNFRNRVMTPVIDVRGNVIAFGGRVLDDTKPKYVNTAETLVYKKTNELFGLNFAKDNAQQGLILCEGYMDVIAMHQAGFTNAVAGCGTALTNEQVRLISRYTDNIYLIYDSDEAGQKALRKAISLFENTDVKMHIPRLTGGKDPDEIIRNLGKARFEAMLDSSSNEIEFELLSLKSQFDISTTQGKSAYATQAVRRLAGCSPIERDLYLSRLSEELGIEKRSLLAELEEYSRRMNYKNRRKKFQNIIEQDIRSTRKESFESSTPTVSLKAQERIIGLLMTYPDCSKQCADLSDEMFAAGFYRKAYSSILKRIKENLSLDLIMFNEVLTDDEMGKLTRLVASTQNSSDPKKEFFDCSQIVKKEFEKSNAPSASQMDDDAFRNMFKKNT